MDNDNTAAETPGPGGQNRKKRQILTGGAIKAIGLVLMTLDHLHQMFINQGAPGWLSWFGRPAATLFLFLCAEGFYYTRSKKTYLLRFLAAFILMNVLNRLLTEFLYVENVALINNVFGSLFMSAFYMLIIDLFREG
ncbi:MAG: conjugal transfer protein TraX, partial [Treponema sp.]|nr:conjugal transfer protein TraX [Treponema sp.]